MKTPRLLFLPLIPETVLRFISLSLSLSLSVFHFVQFYWSIADTSRKVDKNVTVTEDLKTSAVLS